MTIIKGKTKRAEQMRERARQNLGTELSDVYGSFSPAKASAMKGCKYMCESEHGKNFRIISRNSFGFSVAWETEKGLRIETPQNSYLVEVA